MDDKITVRVKGVDYSGNADDPRMHITRKRDIVEETRFENIKLLEKLSRKVNEIKL